MATTNDRARLHPVLLSGGSGVRLWPMSRQLSPKQLLKLLSDRSMLQETMLRVSDPQRFAGPLIICNNEHRFLIAEQLRELDIAGEVILEPVGRNTAPALAVAALRVAAADPDGLMLVLPADHAVRDLPAFRAAVDLGASVAADGRLVTFGITADRPETGYGYIRQGAPIAGFAGVHTIDRFIEKPSPDVARDLLAMGGHHWNSGMFLFPAALFLAELERHAPAVLAAARAALEGGSRDLDFFRLDGTAFAEAPDISVDYAVMERTGRAAVIPVDLGWNDVGTWTTLWEVSGKDADGNACVGDVVVSDARNCYVRSEELLTAVVGLDDVIVVVSEDAVLVAHKNKAQDIKAVVERLKKEGRSEPQNHRRVHRPWGFYQSVHTGDRFQVKRLTVKPGAKLSLQKHFHRSEHWVVVNGTALVTRDGTEVLLHENESVYIPLGAVHRLENPGKIPLNLIEVQSGSYLGEDDIVRLDDVYSRM